MGFKRKIGGMGPWPFLLISLFLNGSCASLYFQRVAAPEDPPKIQSLHDLPYRELWSGFVFNGEKIGFTRLKMIPQEEKFVITSEAHLRLRFLGMDKQITMIREDTVEPDLGLVCFSYEQKIDQKSWTLQGTFEAGRFQATHRSGQQTDLIEMRIPDPIYPASVINLYPVLKGLAVGSSFQYVVFDPQTQSFPEVSQRVVAFEESPKLKLEPAYRVETEMLEHRVSTWINPKGEPIFELGMGGVLITFKEEPEVARRFLSEASLNKKDLVLDFSLVKTQKPLPCPREAGFLKVALEGVLEEMTALQGPGQQAIIEITGKKGLAVYEIYNDRVSPPQMADPRLDPSALSSYLSATPHLEVDHPEIQKAAREAIAGSSSPLEMVQRLARWVSEEVKDEMVESFSALEVLHTRKGECQAHTLLYAAMARSIGIPTRMVGGLVYVDGMGFLYHSWAESYLDGWLAIDPTFHQVGVDATHIKLVQGPSWASLLSLGKVVGKIKAHILDYQSACTK